MESLKEKVIKAILDDNYSEEELECFYSKTFYEQKLLEAMTVISSIEVTEGFINDAYYSNIMEEIEERREAFKGYTFPSSLAHFGLLSKIPSL